MRRFALMAAATCCAAMVAGSASAQTFTEPFDDPFIDWTTRWFYQNSNAGNYYVAAGNCNEGNRGNNPCGLWITDTQVCGGGNGGPTSTITFDPAFGAQIQSFAFDLSAYVDQRLTIYDMSNNVVLDVPTVVRTNNNCAGHRYTATSNNGVSRIVMDSTGHSGSQIEGNTAWDNVEAILGGGGFTIRLSGSCPGQKTLAWDNAGSGQMGIVVGNSQGNTIIPFGPCQGTQLGISGGLILYNVIGTQGGSGQVSQTVGTQACGKFVQCINTGTCDTSNVAGPI